MTKAQTVANVMQKMESNFKANKAAAMNATFQFDITGDGGGQWNAVVEDDTVNFKEGTAAGANVTITTSDKDWVRISTGQLNPHMAFMTGKMKVKGDLGLATKLGALFL